MGKNEEKSRKKTILSWVIIIIMVLSIAGIAFTSGDRFAENSDPTLREVQLQQFTDKESGIQYWGALKNGERFIFMDVTGYDNRTDLFELATKIKPKMFIDVLIDANYSSYDSVYMIEKALRGLKIQNKRVANATCSDGVLILTNNASKFSGDCLVFAPVEGEEYADSEVLQYQLIK